MYIYGIKKKINFNIGFVATTGEKVCCGNFLKNFTFFEQKLLNVFCDSVKIHIDFKLVQLNKK